jgi:hypothetical protein
VADEIASAIATATVAPYRFGLKAGSRTSKKNLTIASPAFEMSALACV